MKKIWLTSAAVLLFGTLACAYAQSQEPPQQQQPPVVYGRGRGGIPLAWNDLDKDGVCDLTGQPVGQRPIAYGWGRGLGGGWGRWAVAGQVAGQVPAQVPGQTPGQVPTLYGRGRGGVPYAWNDVNRDGICDLTGQPVGQRPIAFGGGMGLGRGRGLVGGWGRGAGRGRGGRWWR